MLKKLFLMACVILIPLQGFAPQQKALYITTEPPIRPYEALWIATCMVESSNNPMAYNPLEKATGIAQVRPIRLLDYNQRTGKDYKLRDCYNTKISKEIWLYYITKFRPDDLKSICKVWNGNGDKHKDYMEKIKKCLKN
jgi:hypothetical protein